MNISDITHRIGESTAPVPQNPREALPGTTPRPFWTREKGECRFILEAFPTSPADALTCCAPTTANYCPEHQKICERVIDPTTKKRNERDLVRRFARS